MTIRNLALGTATAIAALLPTTPALAVATATQTATVDAQLASTITLGLSVSGVSFGPISANDPTGATNTHAGGTATVTANTGYSLTVASDRTAMTEWTGTAYVSPNPRSLAAPLRVLCGGATGTGATCVATPATSILTTGVVVASSAVGTGASAHTYTITFSQPTTLADPPAAYHLGLTFTASTLL